MLRTETKAGDELDEFVILRKNLRTIQEAATALYSSPPPNMDERRDIAHRLDLIIDEAVRLYR